jgi:predicted RNase H-like HicB family nuclease
METAKMVLKVVIEAGEDKGFVAHVPALRGCWSQGDTRGDALNNIREAITAWLETEQDKTDRNSSTQSIELVTV